MSRESSLDELIGADTTGAERQRLQQVHDLLLRAGPPAELTPEVESGPNLGLTFARRRGVVKQRAMLLLAAALVTVLVFLGGYAVGNGGKNANRTTTPVAKLMLKGTSAAPLAQASLEVWRPRNGNWPMTLTVVGLSKLSPRRYYEVYVLRHGKILGACGLFRVTNRQPVTVDLTAPYRLHKGDSWVVTRQGAGGTEPGTTVLQPVSA